uniref:Uncharacterized protein LOC105633127 isoform X2 n=1 Tax=Rhizophora mucronata TaxID=61149 RepID=A0A2P2MFE0_RHIMU
MFSAFLMICSDEHGSSNGQVDHFDEPESPTELHEEVPQSDGNDALDADSKDGNLKKDVIFPQEGHQDAATQIAPTYGFGVMQPIHEGNLAQFDRLEAQTQDISCVSSFVSENPTASPSPSPTPPVQNSVAAPLHPFLFRPPYPPNFFPYGHYFNPFFTPPMHHFISHSGLPQQPSTGNAYLTPAATGPTVKLSVKPGTSAGNPTPVGLSALYGSYGSSPIGFSPGPAVTFGGSAGKEDISASQLKENGTFSTGPVSEVPAWFISPGQDISGIQLNPLYHIPAQGQHLTFSHGQAGHRPFTGVYPPLQAMTTSTTNLLLQQSQTISTAFETVGLPSGT